MRGRFVEGGQSLAEFIPIAQLPRVRTSFGLKAKLRQAIGRPGWVIAERWCGLRDYRGRENRQSRKRWSANYLRGDCTLTFWTGTTFATGLIPIWAFRQRIGSKTFGG